MTSVFDHISSTFLLDTAAFIGALLILNLYIYFIIEIAKRIPENLWIINLDAKSQSELRSYFVTICSHLYIVPASILLIYSNNDPNLGQSNIDISSRLAAYKVIPCMVAHLIVDTFTAVIPDWIIFNHPDSAVYMFHHIISFIITYTILCGPDSISVYLPHLLICEFSQIFNIIRVVLSIIKSPLKKTLFYSVIEAGFIVSFVSLRIVNLGFAFYNILHLLGLYECTFIFAPLYLLQVYWLFLIVAKLLSRRKNKKNGDSKESAVKVKGQ